MWGIRERGWGNIIGLGIRGDCLFEGDGFIKVGVLNFMEGMIIKEGERVDGCWNVSWSGYIIIF